MANKALSLDGIDDYVDIPNSTSLGVQYVTIEVWLKWNGTGHGRQYIVDGRAHNYMIFIDTPKELNFLVKVGGVFQYVIANIDELLDGDWHYLVGTYDGLKAKLYFDAILKNELVKSGVINIASGIACIGCYIGHTPGNYRTNGLIDEVRISNIARAPEEIPVNWDNGLGKKLEVDEHTVALWHMDEGEGGIIFDETENGNDGSIIGASWVDGFPFPVKSAILGPFPTHFRV